MPDTMEKGAAHRNIKKIARLLWVPLLLFSCHSEELKNNELFTLLPSSFTGVEFINQLTENEQFNIIEYLYFNNGAGVAAGDINNDGLIDLYFTSNQKKNKLYLNKGNLKFEDITESAGVAGSGDWKTGVTMADINGDGLLDIYICQVGKYKSIKGKNQLFINQGNLTFKEEAQEYGLDFQGFSTQAAFFDYDLDGDLDMYLLNHSVHTSRSYGDVSLRNDHDTLAGDRFFRNDQVNGKITFHDVTKETGIYSSQIGYGLAINISDINNDGYPDIYISNDFHENDYLYINNKNSTFSEKSKESIAHSSRSSMGNDIGDINNDGLADIMVLDMLPDKEKIRKQSGGEDDYELFRLKLRYGYNYQFVRNTLQLNLGGGLFSEIGQYAGVSSTDWSWSPLLFDVDNDGWKDLFITNGIYRRANDLDYVSFLTGGNRKAPSKDNSKLSDKSLYEKMPLYPNISFMFRNNGDLTFSNMAEEWGINKPSYSNGAAYADLDNDGDLDLIVNNINSKAFIYENNEETVSGNHFLSIGFKGDSLNRYGIGAKVTIYNKGQLQISEQFTNHGFLSGTTGKLHFGLGTAKLIDSLIVRWPDLKIQKIENIKCDTSITLNINDAMSVETLHATSLQQVNKIFEQTLIPGLVFTHKEDEWVDFYREQLIPHSLSSEGPALAVGDVNNDGLQDIFCGGARGQVSEIFIQKNDGSFKIANVPALQKEILTDVVDATFFDADGDGDQDLYIVRGGNQLVVGNPALTDLLLINDGKGNFSKSDSPLMSHNGSFARACDFDGDGDIDLFVGSRSVPGSYGVSPDQFLLDNNGKGHFRDITDKVASGLRKIGMATDAVWSDYDKDGDMDLIVTGEWMKICIFRNDKGYFSDVTKSAGLDETSGWWNCIKAADIDSDGDIDLIAGNLGLNTSLKASVKEPVQIYLNDFDNNGTIDPIICSYEKGVSYPFASFDELSSQIAGFDKKFKSYSDFGGKTLTDIFGKNAIEQSLVKKADMFESAVFLNNGDGTFKAVILPKEVQFSPARDILIQDFNNDSIKDLLIVGNNYAVNPSYGRYDASYGWYLPGADNDVFTTLLPLASGFRINGDSRKLVPIVVKGRHFIIAAINNSSLQIYKY